MKVTYHKYDGTPSGFDKMLEKLRMPRYECHYLEIDGSAIRSDGIKMNKGDVYWSYDDESNS
jgi:hypothetical protein